MFFLLIIKVIMHSFLSFSLVFPQLFFFINIRLSRFDSFLFLSSVFKCSFCSSSRLSHIAFFPFFSYILICYFSSTLRLSNFAFFLLLSSIFNCCFCSSSRLSHIAFFPFFNYFLNCSFSLLSRLPCFIFFFCYPLFVNVLFLSLTLSCINLFLFYHFLYSYDVRILTFSSLKIRLSLNRFFLLLPE